MCIIDRDIPVVLRPGYISLEMLRETLGDVRMDKGLIKPDSKIHPTAPGMKYRHYAPKADLAIVEGSTEGVIAEIEKRAGEAEEKGLTAVSYTHLDVYKRQIWAFVLIWDIIW